MLGILAHQGKYAKIDDFFYIFPAHAKIGPRGPQMGPGGFFPTNPNLADILGDTDVDFENFYFWDFFGSQISGLGPAWAQVGPSLGPAWSQRGPCLGPPAWAQLGPTHLGPAWAHPLGPGLGPPTWAQLGPTNLGPARPKNVDFLL